MTLFRLLGTITLCILIGWVAWPLGGNSPLARTLVGLFAVVLLGLAFFEQIRTRFPQRISGAWIFLAVGLGYAIFQVSPASDFFNQVDFGLSTLDASLSPDDPRSAVFQPSRFNCVSYYPAASRAAIAELAFAVGIFLATASLVKSRVSVSAIFLSITITGVAIVFFAIAQRLMWNGKIYWTYEFTAGASPFGPFVNRNNAGNFALACICGAMFFVAYQYFRWNPQADAKSDLGYEWADSNRGKSKLSQWYRDFLGLIAAIQPNHLYSSAAMIFIAVGVAMTLSRGAMLGLLSLAITALLLLSFGNRIVILLFGLLTLVGGGLMVWLDQSDAVITRIKSFQNLQQAAGPRFQHWQDIWPYLTEHCILGSGLGTYRYMQMPFQQEFSESSFAHAENVYIETVAELGIIGLVCLLGFLTACVWLSLNLYRRKFALDRALGVAGICCVVSQGVTALFDFAVYQPANAVVVALILGSVVGRATCSENSADPNYESANSEAASWLSVGIRTAVLLTCAILCVLGIRQSYGVELVKSAKSSLQKYNRSMGENEHELSSALASLETAQNLCPDDAEVDFQLGEYYLASFRQENTNMLLRLAGEFAKEDASLAEPNPSVDNGVNSSSPGLGSDSVGEGPDDGSATSFTRSGIWLNNSVMALHRVFRFAQRNNPELVQEMKSNPNMVLLEQAWERFETADRKCSFPPKHQFRLAQLSAFFDPGKESEHLGEALRRTSPSSDLLFEAGLLALDSGDQATAVRLWRECLAHSLRFESQIVEAAMHELPMKTLFVELLPQDPEYLLRISVKYVYQGKKTLPNMFLLGHTSALLKTAQMPEQRRLFLLGEIERQLENFESAANYYRLALGVDDQDIDCRVKLAFCLQKTNKLEEAVKHLKICELTPGSHITAVRAALKQIRNQRMIPIDD